MNPLGLDRVILQDSVFFGLFFFGRKSLIFKVGKQLADIRQYEEIRIVRFPGHHIETFVCHIDTVILFIDYKIEVVRNLRHTTVVICHIDSLGFEQQRFNTRFAQIFDKRPVLR